MKKLIALALAVVTAMSCSMMAFAANTTTLTTTVPGATYTLNIPADQEIPFGKEEVSIGKITVTNSTGFGVGKNLHVTINYDAFVCNNDSVTTTIPYTLQLFNTADSEEKLIVESGSTVIFKGNSSERVPEYLPSPNESWKNLNDTRIIVNSGAWGKAMPGTYSSVITFTTEVVTAQ
jgi:hypothetical protein